MNVLNMLNTKYFIVRGEAGPVAQGNPAALGNAWFVNQYRLVKNADEEITALDNFKPESEAVVDERFQNQLAGLNQNQQIQGEINLTSYAPNKLTYTSTANQEALAVFSEIYYAAGWNAYVDGQQVDHMRANYVLRAMRIPAGQHEITFKFEPSFYYYSTIISAVFSILLILLLAMLPYREYKKRMELVAHE